MCLSSDITRLDIFLFFFFFNDTATTEIYTLSLHDALPTSDATSKQDHPSNVNIPVRIFSKGDDGSVTQDNSSKAVSAAGNKNETTQQSEQGSGAPSAPVRGACGGGCGDHGGPSVQDAEQSSFNKQSADSSASSEQDHASNVNVPVRIFSPGDDGDVSQTNSSKAISAAGNKNSTDQSAEQSAGGSGGDPVQYVGQKAGSWQDASSDATSHQSGASNANYPVRIGSPGDGGSVDQTNSSKAVSAAGNKNETDQSASQDAGSVPELAKVKDGCGECGSDGGPAVQAIDQKATNWQQADSSADSTQCCASNTNAPVRIKSYGDDGDVSQSNSSSAISVAGNKNDTTQEASQDAGSGFEPVKDGCKDECGHGDGAPVVQQIGQWASNGQKADSSADSTQKDASNSNSPVRIKSDGGGGDVSQSNSSSALSAAGNKNDTTQDASQSVGGLKEAPVLHEDGCGSCGGGSDATVQAIGQWASSGQKADSSADSTQDGACNTNEPVRIKSAGDDGDVSQSNSSLAASAAGNANGTDQSADQSAGGWGGIADQAIGQKADNGQHASSDATSKQYAPSNSNAPVRIHSKGGGGSVEQSNASSAASAAGNRNRTCQRAQQGSLEAPLCVKKARKPVVVKQDD